MTPHSAFYLKDCWNMRKTFRIFLINPEIMIRAAFESVTSRIWRYTNLFTVGPFWVQLLILDFAIK